MPRSIRPFKTAENKVITSDRYLDKPKNMVRQKTLEGDRKERMMKWITFWRRNPHRFIETFFGIHLHPFQILMIWVLQRSTLAYIVASRAASKTFIIAIWAMTLAVLYPGIKIVVCSKTIKQGSLVVGKIRELTNDHPNVMREIRSITINSNLAEVMFHCGSHILVVPSSDSARGNRASYIIIEESRLVPREILESVIKPMLEVRTPPFRNKLEYRNESLLKEEPITSYITSAWYKAEYWFTYVKSCIRRMAMGDEGANFLAFDYLITLYHNIKTEETLKNEMGDADAVTVDMEYLNIPSGSSGKAFFKPVLFDRKLKQAFYPLAEDDFDRKKPNEFKKLEGELRFVGVDVSTRANKANDLSIIGCVRAIPLMGRGYERHLVYLESHKGQHVGIQAKRIKEIFTDFEADYIVLDLQNAGIAVFDSLSEPTLCEERGITFPAMGVVDETYEIIRQETRDDLRDSHTRGLNALPVVFPISATAVLNSQIATAFRSAMQKKLFKYLVTDNEAEEFLLKKDKEFMKNANDSEYVATKLAPYVNTNLLIGECINLDMSLVNGIIKLTEKSSAYKDRYSMISYLNWIISQQFDLLLLKETGNEDDFSYIMSLVQST